MNLGRRIREAVRRRGLRPPTGEERWARFLSQVEPAIAAAPRLHRFATPPLIGEPGTEAHPIAAWVGPGSDLAAARTRRALEHGTRMPAEVLEGSLRQALAGTRAEWVAIAPAGLEPAPLALERLGQAAVLAPGAVLLTCDEDRVAEDGRRVQPRFRPAPSPDRWLADDTSGSLLVVAREPALRALAGLRGGSGTSHELALALLLGGDPTTRAAHVPMLLAHRGPELPEPRALAPEVVQELLARWDPGARVESGPDVRQIRRTIEGEPSIEVIVCLRDRPELLRRCADSLLATTAYEHVRLALVDNGSERAETQELLARYERDARVRVLHDPRPFNFASLNNAAARSSAAEVLVFLNNDTEIVQAGWIEPLLEEALRPEVGAVAPLLLFPDGTVQHSGAALGLHGYAGHPFAGLRPERETSFGRANGGTRNWLAVTAACMMVTRARFESVGGFDESFIVAGNDVDLCLRLTAAGHRSLCVPQAIVIHDESRSRGAHIDPADFVRSEQSYGSFRTVGDPFYNPNLTLEATDCGVRGPGELAR